jgi:7-keto-8-aminopelargonate synthetase-like enzyme
VLGPHLKFIDRDYVIYQDQKLLFFGGTDYHRMSKHPKVLKAMSDASIEYGLSCTGSRTTTGNHPLYFELEQKIAEFFGTESAVVFGSGYLANIILLQVIEEDFKIFILDELSHSSLVDAAKIFKKNIVYFRHNDPVHLEEQLRKNSHRGARALIMTDGVFAARGEFPPLIEYAELAREYHAKILTDDAHGMATVGKNGRGSWEEFGIDRELIFQTGTLSKAFGVYGGIITGSKQLISKIHKKSLAFIGSTGLPLPLIVAAIQSVSYLHSKFQIIQDLQKKSSDIKQKLASLGFDLPQSPTPIVSITKYDEQKNQYLYQILMEKEIYPPFINYPGGPEGGHFRFALSSHHTSAQINLLFEAIKSSLD